MVDSSAVPTAYAQGTFCVECYKGREELDDVLGASGFKLQEKGGSEAAFDMYVSECVPGGWRGGGRGRTVTVGFILKAADVVSSLEVVGAGSQAVQMVQTACSRMIQRLNRFVGEHPQLRRNGNSVKVCLAGHSLGGFVAAAVTVSLKDWADRNGCELMCTTFDSPGISGYYLDIAEQQETRNGWKDIICNYVALPNIVNMAYEHLGRIVHLDSSNSTTNLLWMARCAIRTLTSLASKQEDMENSSIMCLVGAYLGIEAMWGLQQHSLSNMIGAFQKRTGLPHPNAALEMESWPSYTSIGSFMAQNFTQVLDLLDGLGPDSIGLLNMRNREQVIWRRLNAIEGFTPAHGQGTLNISDCSEPVETIRYVCQ